MRIVRLDAIGGPENLNIVEVPIPEVGDDDVLIKSALIGLIYGDTELRRGTYFSRTILPFFPGREVAGTVVAVGKNVDSYQIGDRVIALILAGGACADYVIGSTTPKNKPDGSKRLADDIVKITADISFESALPYLTNFRLAYLLFHESSKVPRGATILIHGASGGMGSMLIQLAHAHGCIVIATCRNASEEEYCRGLGANEVVITEQEDYVARVKVITQGRGVDFSFNGVGGETLNRDFDVMVPFGEIQAYGYVAGKTAFDVFRVGKCISLKTFSANDFLATPMFENASAAMQEWFATGPLTAVGTVLSLADVADANRLLDSGAVIGKIALRP
jgi:NADPH2:quinone reductase